MMSGILDQLENPTFASRIVLDTLLHGITVRLIAEAPPSRGGEQRRPFDIARRLRRVRDFIDANLAPTSNGGPRSVAGSSRFHFSRAFRTRRGFPLPLFDPPPDRCRKSSVAVDMLSIAEIANQCGFNSQAQFHGNVPRVFEQVRRFPPRALYGAEGKVAGILRSATLYCS
jgi:AraC-like DNA-binding protein